MKYAYVRTLKRGNVRVRVLDTFIWNGLVFFLHKALENPAVLVCTEHKTGASIYKLDDCTDRAEFINHCRYILRKAGLDNVLRTIQITLSCDGLPF